MVKLDHTVFVIQPAKKKPDADQISSCHILLMIFVNTVCLLKVLIYYLVKDIVNWNKIK